MSIRAVVIGLLAGFFAGMLWSAAIALALAPRLANTSNPAAALHAMPEFIGISLVGALGSAFLSGWVAGRLARGEEAANALAVGIVVVLLSACLFMPLQMNTYPLWYNVPAFLLTVPFALAGGLIVRKSRAT